MSLKDVIKKIVDSNEWLSGVADFMDGDIVALVNQSEKFEREPTEYTDLGKLFADLKNYEGVFKYKNLLFFSDWRYGTFVYDINKPEVGYVEHLTTDALSFERFLKVVNSLAP